MWQPTITSDEIMHSAKGSHWKNHLYTAIKNGVYIYPKAAAKARKNYKKYNDEFEYYTHKTGLQSAVKALHGKQAASTYRPDATYAQKSLGQNADNNSISYNSNKAGNAWLKREEAYKSAESYEKLAKQNLDLAKKEVILEGKRIFDSILKKLHNAVYPVHNIGTDSDYKKKGK